MCSRSRVPRQVVGGAWAKCSLGVARPGPASLGDPAWPGPAAQVSRGAPAGSPTALPASVSPNSSCLFFVELVHYFVSNSSSTLCRIRPAVSYGFAVTAWALARSAQSKPLLPAEAPALWPSESGTTCRFKVGALRLHQDWARAHFPALRKASLSSRSLAPRGVPLSSAWPLRFDSTRR